MAFDATLSTAIVGAYMAFTMLLGLYAWRISPSVDVEDYVLADRAVHWFVGFFSTAASQFSALSFMGFIAFYFNFGVSAYIAIAGAYVIFTSGTYYMLGTKVWKLGRKFGHITPSDTVRDYYDSPVLGYVVAAGMVLALIPYLVVQFLGVGILLKLATGGLVPITAGAGIIAVVIAVYTWLGGMQAVAWVDTMQGVMLLGGTFIGGLVLVFTVGDGFTPAYQAILDSKPALLGVPGPAGVFDWTYIVTFAVPVFLGWVYHPHMWIRLHYFDSGRAVENLPWVTGGIEWLIQLGGWFTVLAGVLVIPDAPPDQFLLLMFRQFFPTVVFALIASAGIAAMMSSASSQCHGIGTVVSRDITQQLRPEWGEDRHLLAARVATTVAILGAFVLATFGIKFLLTSGAAAAALSTSLIFPQVVAAVYGAEWPTKAGAIAASVLGGTTSLLFLAVPQVQSAFGVWGGFWGLVVSVVVFVGVSLVTSSTPEKSTIESWKSVYTQSFAELDEEHRDRRSVTGSDD